MKPADSLCLCNWFHTFKLRSSFVSVLSGDTQDKVHSIHVVPVAMPTILQRAASCWPLAKHMTNCELKVIKKKQKNWRGRSRQRRRAGSGRNQRKRWRKRRLKEKKETRLNRSAVTPPYLSVPAFSHKCHRSFSLFFSPSISRSITPFLVPAVHSSVSLLICSFLHHTLSLCLLNNFFPPSLISLKHSIFFNKHFSWITLWELAHMYSANIDYFSLGEHTKRYSYMLLNGFLFFFCLPSSCVDP